MMTQVLLSQLSPPVAYMQHIILWPLWCVVQRSNRIQELVVRTDLWLLAVRGTVILLRYPVPSAKKTRTTHRQYNRAIMSKIKVISKIMSKSPSLSAFARFLILDGTSCFMFLVCVTGERLSSLGKPYCVCVTLCVCDCVCVSCVCCVTVTVIR